MDIFEQHKDYFFCMPKYQNNVKLAGKCLLNTVTRVYLKHCVKHN